MGRGFPVSSVNEDLVDSVAIGAKLPQSVGFSEYGFTTRFAGCDE